MPIENLTPEGMLKMPVAALAPTGSVQADAAPITTGGIVVVTGADATKGVMLPAIDTDRIGAILIIVNATAAVLKVWPEVGGTIDAVAANGNVSVIASANAFFVATAAKTWMMCNVVRL
jgi:hypothetical protein